MIRASIIIPTCNRAEWLNTTIQSIIAQECPTSEYEILIADNGSKDNTKEVIEELILKHPSYNIKYLYEKEPGSMSARHCGALQAKGNIFIFIDDDVEVGEDWLTAISEAFGDASVHLVGGPSIPKFDTSPPDWISNYCKVENGRVTCGHLSLLDIGDKKIDINSIYIWSLNFAIRKKTFFEAGGFHPCVIPKKLQHFQGDGETGLSLKIKEMGYKAAYDPRVKVLHYIPRERLTVSFFEGRNYYQGVCDSYTQIRKNNGLSNIKIPDYHIFEQFSPNIPVYDQYKQIIYKRIHNAYVDGFLFHQEAVRKSKTLLKWVLKEDYFNYRLPELDPQEQQQIQEVRDHIQKRSTQPQWPQATAQDMFKEAFNLINSDDIVTALSKLDTIVHQYPNMPKVNLTRALCLSALARPQEAVRAAIAELTIQPDNKQAVDILLKNQQVLLEEMKTASRTTVQFVERVLKSRFNQV
ncbi:glycosyltransferase [Candidatus Kuenenia sp.]|uniref:glycosyltransferase n=1 Tax=Candidatus Kuenenia sp. TaxID=2499824 RepID=UPI00321FB6CF